FNIEAKLIKDNEGGTVIARYEIKRAAGGTSYSNALELRVGAALDIDQSVMKLDGNNYYMSPISAHKPDWVRVNFKAPQTYETRVPANGAPPYVYTSENPDIATVDDTGLVHSISNGSTTIVVQDADNRTAEFPVECSNVFELCAFPDQLNWKDAQAALARENLEPILARGNFVDELGPQFQATTVPSPQGEKYYGPVFADGNPPQIYIYATGRASEDRGLNIDITNPDDRYRYIGRKTK
ncbi:Ig-like domain-containing protein, partial [Pseudomonas sp. SWRI81]|uniref:Ig-like domain-containing protein n=1 Tax=Pseudomonas sp. SWRI81 TaxID=2745505 RepID=UPI00164435E8